MSRLRQEVDTIMKEKIFGLGSIINSYAEYLLVMLIIVNCNSLFIHSVGANSNTIICVLALALAMAILCYHLLFFKVLRERIKLFIGTAICIVVYSGIYLLINIFVQDNAKIYKEFILLFILFLPVVSAIFFCHRQLGKPYELLYKYSNLVCVTAFLNLTLFIIVTLCPELIKFDIVETRWSNTGDIRTLHNYFNFLNVEMIDSRSIMGNIVYRNNGLFPEPLMYCIPLLTALFVEMFLRNNKWSIVKYILFSVTLISTFSTLGTIILIISLGGKCVHICRPEIRKKLIYPILLLGLVFITYLVGAKVNRESISSLSSTGIHIDDYKLGLKAFFKSPFMGGGFKNEDYIRTFMSVERLRYNRGFSNSLSVILGEGGIFLGLLCMIPFAAGILQIFSKRDKNAAFWMTGVFLLYALTIFHFRLFLLLILAYGYSFVTMDFYNKNYFPRISIYEEVLDNNYVNYNGYGQTLKCKVSFDIIILLCYYVLVLLLIKCELLWERLYVLFKNNYLYLSQSWWRPLLIVSVVILIIMLLDKSIKNIVKSDKFHY